MRRKVSVILRASRPPLPSFSWRKLHRRVGAGVAPRPSHRSVLAQLRHTALQARASLRGGKLRRAPAAGAKPAGASSAIRCCPEHTVLELKVSIVFPSNGSLTRRPLPFAGSPWGGFPRCRGTMRRSDSLRTFLPPFVILRLAVPSRAPVFVSPLGSDAGPGAWSFGVGSSTPMLSRWSRRVSQVPGQP